MRGKLLLATGLLAALSCLSIARAETVQEGALRVSFDGALSPTRLPRQGTKPITVTIGGRVKTTDGSEPPQLQRIAIAINRHGKLDTKGLPSCRIDQIQPSTNEDALRACGPSKVGEGRFFAYVAIPGQAPFPARGKLIAFNGREGGKPVIFAHVYGENPVPTSYTLALAITKSKGTFATTLSTSLPHVTGKAGFITGIELTLHRDFTYKGARHSFLSAGCPAPAGAGVAPFKLARASFGFADRTLSRVLVRSCRAG